jgi:LacI family gluconate utilization system Gnt-I transcriptional repressor
MADNKILASGMSMKEVAKLAGVSMMTVSRAMRTPDLVSAETLLSVRAVIDKVGYLPNRVAGSLSSKSTTLVALIVPNLRNALYAEMIQGISDVLQRHQYQLMISDSGYSLEEEEKLINAYAAQRVCGIILHNTKHTDRAVQLLKNTGIPCVETGNLRPSAIDMQVSYSNHSAGRAMAEHLVSLGYKRLGFASLPVKQSDRLRERRAGFFAGLRKAGIHIAPELILEVGPGLESGARALGQIVDTDPQVDAVFFAGDVLAAGAIFECQRRKLKVPSRIAVAASDDNELMRNIIPSLTTVAFPRYQIGVKSAEMIVARSKGITPNQMRIDLGFEVIRRAST